MPKVSTQSQTCSSYSRQHEGDCAREGSLKVQCMMGPKRWGRGVSVRLLWLSGFHRHDQWWLSAAYDRLCFSLLGFIVIPRSDLAPYVSVSVLTLLSSKRKKKTNYGCWSTSRSPSRTAPQGVVTWQWLALWHRPSNWHCQSFTQTPTCKFLIWQHVPLYAWPIDACTGSSFTNRVDKGSKLLTE